MLLILVGSGIMLYVASSIVEVIVLGRVAEALGVRRWSRRIHRMRDHYIICGYGRIGAAVAEELQAHDLETLIIDEDDARLVLARDHGILALGGDATDESVLIEAQTPVAKALIASTESDAENTFIALTARALNPDIFIVAVARSETAEPRMRAAGADRVFFLHRIAGRRMALAAMQPMLADVVDTLAGMRPGAVLAELVVADAAQGLEGQTVDEAFSGLGSVRVLGLERQGSELEVGPSGDTTLHHGDRLLLYGAEAEIERLSHNHPQEQARSGASAER
jgi:voltage-gated potassium channel